MRRPTVTTNLAEGRADCFYLSDVDVTNTAREIGLLLCFTYLLKAVSGLNMFFLHVNSLLTTHGQYVN